VPSRHRSNAAVTSERCNSAGDGGSLVGGVAHAANAAASDQATRGRRAGSVV
jgi:hypothetical protein